MRTPFRRILVRPTYKHAVPLQKTAPRTHLIWVANGLRRSSMNSWTSVPVHGGHVGKPSRLRPECPQCHPRRKRRRAQPLSFRDGLPDTLPVLHALNSILTSSLYSIHAYSLVAPVTSSSHQARMALVHDSTPERTQALAQSSGSDPAGYPDEEANSYEQRRHVVKEDATYLHVLESICDESG